MSKVHAPGQLGLSCRFEFLFLGFFVRTDYDVT